MMNEETSKLFTNSEIERILEGHNDDYSLWETGTWKGGDVCQYLTNIVKDKEDRFWSITIHRVGGMVEGWRYSNDTYMYQVKEVELTEKKWVPICYLK